MEVHILFAHDYDGSNVLEISKNREQLVAKAAIGMAYSSTEPLVGEGCTFEDNCPIYKKYSDELDVWHKNHPLGSVAIYYSNFSVKTYQVTE